MAKPEIQRFLVLSTAHIPQTVDAALTANIEAYPAVAINAIAFGYLLWVGEDPAPAGEPWDTIYAYAKKHHCPYVKLDCDGPVMPDLPSWDW